MCELEAGACQRHLPSASAIESCAAAAADLWHTQKKFRVESEAHSRETGRTGL